MALTTTLVTYKFDKEGVVRRVRGSISGTYTAASVNSATAPSTTAAGGGIANQRAVNDVLITGGVMTITLGFVPSKFMAINVTDKIRQEWFAGMAAANFLENQVTCPKYQGNYTLCLKYNPWYG